jgi:hypothetical protein
LTPIKHSSTGGITEIESAKNSGHYPASFLATEKNFRRIMGWKDLWQLKVILGREKAAIKQEVA